MRWLFPTLSFFWPLISLGAALSLRAWSLGPVSPASMILRDLLVLVESLPRSALYLSVCHSVRKGEEAKARPSSSSRTGSLHLPASTAVCLDPGVLLGSPHKRDSFCFQFPFLRNKEAYPFPCFSYEILGFSRVLGAWCREEFSLLCFPQRSQQLRV